MPQHILDNSLESDAHADEQNLETSGELPLEGQGVNTASRGNANTPGALPLRAGATHPGHGGHHRHHRGGAQRRRRRISRRTLGALALVVYLAIFAAVIALGFAVVDHLTQSNDVTLEKTLQAVHNPAFFGLMDWVSAIGYPIESAAIAVAAVLTLWVLRLRLEALFVALANIADGIGDLVKSLVERHRPLADVVHVYIHLHSYSFPSGHTVHYTAFYGMLIVVILSRFHPSFGRALWVAFFAVLIVLIGPSRVYLGEHYPSDVIAGYAIGLLWLAPLAWAYTWMRTHPRRLPYSGWLYPAEHPRIESRA